MAAPCPTFGFLLEMHVEPLDASRSAALLASFRELLRSRGLEHDGATDAGHWSLVIRSEASQATHADRQAVEEWVARHPEIGEFRIGPLVDVRSP